MTTIEKLNALCQKYTTKEHPVYMIGNTLYACDWGFNLAPLIKELNNLGVSWDKNLGYFAKDHKSGTLDSCRVDLIVW